MESSVYHLAALLGRLAFSTTPCLIHASLRVPCLLLVLLVVLSDQRRHWSHPRPPDKRIAVIVAARLAARV